MQILYTRKKKVFLIRYFTLSIWKKYIEVKKFIGIITNL